MVSDPIDQWEVLVAEIEMLRAQLKIAKEALMEIETHEFRTGRYPLAHDALKRIKELAA